MVRIVRETDRTPVADIAKKHGVSTETVYQWRRKFGGMDVDDAKKLKALEQENAKLKKLLAECAFRHRDHPDRSIVIARIGAS
jgi:transposase-like protein